MASLVERIVAHVLKLGPKRNNDDIQILFDNGNATPCGIRVAAGANDLEVRTGGGAWGGLPVDPVTRNVTSSTSLTVSDKKKTILVRTNSGAITLSLPTPADGMDFIIKDADGNAATNKITFARAGSEKIEGIAASFVAASNWGTWRILSNGTDWFLI